MLSTLAALLPGTAEAALFATAVAVLNATPGVDFLLTVSRTLQGGLRTGVAAALGISAGCVLHALAAAFGLAALLGLYPGAMQAVQLLGAAYLAWLGIGLLRQGLRRAEALDAAATLPRTEPRTWCTDFRTGLLTNLLNPKVALFFLAFLPQFVPTASPSPTASFLLLGAWFVLQGTLFLLLLALVSARLRRVRASPAALRVLRLSGGALFLGLALRLGGART